MVTIKINRASNRVYIDDVEYEIVNSKRKGLELHLELPGAEEPEPEPEPEPTPDAPEA